MNTKLKSYTVQNKLVFNKILYICKKNIIMKKIILFILVITQISFITAQSLVITGDTMFAGDPNIQIDHHLVVKNTSANPITVKCQKTNLTLPTGAESYYCFAGNCYAASS